jgi:tetratricopeptide (TPR) repeat protein
MRALTSSVLALPEQQKLRTLLGEAQVETGLLAEAVETLTLAAAHDEQQVRVQQQQQHETGEGNRTRDFHTLDMLGVALYLSGRLTDAEVAFGEARAAAPELATGHAKLGSTLMRQGRQAEAANCYGQAIASAQQAVRANVLSVSGLCAFPAVVYSSYSDQSCLSV